MKLLEQHIVKELNQPIRLQDYAVGIFKSAPTKSSIKKAIKKELVLVNGKKATTALFINNKDTIELFESITDYKSTKINLKLSIIFEDDYLAIIYKPAGILVSGNSFYTIKNALPTNLQNSLQLDATTPQPVHRLDYATSGLLLIGKTVSSITKLNQLFEHKKIQKTYHAVCVGNMNEEGVIDVDIDEKKALTHYKVLQSSSSVKFNKLNLVELYPKTGRKHQLRKHLLFLKNPILGDQLYYLPEFYHKGKGLFLHASSLNFTHPFTNENISITKELPSKFKKIFPQ